uniref:Uncharacterized protein n=1 Tax=Anguilla anguilla TaxID=7936 RepID=A0A0E9PEA5_ANGAN
MRVSHESATNQLGFKC